MKQEKKVKHYWREYHYKHDPFDSALHKSRFITDNWDQYLDLLPQFLRYCNSLVLLEGEPGVGKTTLIQQFIQENDGDAEIIFINATEIPGIEFLLKLLHEKFSAPYEADSDTSVNDQLDTQINALKLNKAPRLLIIDDAEKLPLDTRQACLQITQQQTKLDTCLPIILVGSDDLTTQYHALLTSKTAAKSLHFLYLAAFTKEELDDYLQFACEQAGESRGESPFTDEDVETIHKATAGKIGLIDHSARSLLKVKLKQKSNQRDLKKKLIWWGITLVIIVALLILYKFISTPKPLGTQFTKPIALRDHQPLLSQKIHQVGNLQIQDKPEFDSKPQKKITPTPTKTVIAKSPEHKAQQSPIKKGHTVEVNKAVVNKKPMPTTTKKQDSTPLFSHVMQARLQRDQRRIANIANNKVTLQLLAASNLHNVQAFINQHQLQASAMIVQTQKNQKPLYLVIYGIFDNRQQAQQALQTVSPQLRQLKPWIRTYVSLKK